MLGMLAWVGMATGRGMSFFVGLLVAAGLFAFQLYLIRHQEPRACFRAFLNNNYVGLAVFAGLALDYLLTP